MRGKNRDGVSVVMVVMDMMMMMRMLPLLVLQWRNFGRQRLPVVCTHSCYGCRWSRVACYSSSCRMVGQFRSLMLASPFPIPAAELSTEREAWSERPQPTNVSFGGMVGLFSAALFSLSFAYVSKYDKKSGEDNHHHHNNNNNNNPLH